MLRLAVWVMNMTKRLQKAKQAPDVEPEVEPIQHVNYFRLIESR